MRTIPYRVRIHACLYHNMIIYVVHRWKVTKSSFITTLVMLALVPLSYLYYNRLSIDSFSYVNMAIYFAAILLLTAAAVRTFRKDEPKSAVSEGGDADAGPDQNQEPEASPA